MSIPPKSGRLRAMMERPGIIRSLGAHDVFTALIVQEVGFEAVFFGGFGASASLLGLPDLNLITMTEMAEAAGRMAARLDIPVVADGDTGHGDINNVVRTVTEFARQGASGILLEDQVAPKRCGHFEGKEVISPQAMEVRLKAAVEAAAGTGMIIIARTDARQMNGLDDAIDRANRYGDAGVDCVFIEAPQSVDELEAIPRRVRHPLLVNMLTGGVTPILPVSDLEKMGYKIVVYPIESLMVTCKAMMGLAQTLFTRGELSERHADMASFSDLKELLGLQGYLERKRQEG